MGEGAIDSEFLSISAGFVMARVVRQMAVARRRFDTAVAKQLADQLRAAVKVRLFDIVDSHSTLTKSTLACGLESPDHLCSALPGLARLVRLLGRFYEPRLVRAAELTGAQTHRGRRLLS